MLQSVSYSMNSYRHLQYVQPDVADQKPSDTMRHDAGQTPAAPPLQPNGYPMITESCRRDFFTIRADCVQDAVLGSVDSLAEYLVWDGMDRRARAIASANHTSSPEAVVSISQIAADIKSRVGHDLCERTIERAIRKLSDVGLIGIESRFNAGRRQASSYRLLFSDGMKSRLGATRRGKRASTGNPEEQPGMAPNRDEYPPNPERARTESKVTSTDHVHPVLNYGHGLTRIGLMVPSFPLPTIASDSNPLPGPSVHICTQAATDEAKDESAQTTRTGNTERKGITKALGEGENYGLTIKPKSLQHEVAEILHPTSMSPLFNKEEKENKKVFKNVFSISDFIKREQAKESRTALKADPSDSETGYYLDTVHRSGWVSSPKKHLQEYFGSLSTYLFFNKYRTIDAMVEWFQQQENHINCGETTLDYILMMTGISQEESQSEGQKIKRNQ